MKQRIWELDAARGACLFLMIAFHFWYDLVYLFRLVPMGAPGFFRLISHWGYLPFVLICGICATFSSRTFRRGLLVLGGGVIITAVTVCLYLLGLTDKGIIIYFGILHCLGTCMLLWPLLRKLPTWALAAASACMIAAGLFLQYWIRADIFWLIPLGVMPQDFASSDYFPLLPNLGYFLAGAILGRLVYPTKQTLFPKANTRNLFVRFFTFLGRHSLFIYLLHQPVLAGLIGIYLLLF